MHGLKMPLKCMSLPSCISNGIFLLKLQEKQSLKGTVAFAIGLVCLSQLWGIFTV